MKCFVSSCNSDFHGHKYEDDDPLEKFSAHRIPDDPIRRGVWLQAIENAENRVLLTNDINFKTVRLCSKHFRAEDFVTKNGKRFLIITAVPSIFGSSEGSESHFEYPGFNNLQNSTTFNSGNHKKIVRPVKPRKRTLRYAGDADNKDITAEEALILLPKVRAKLRTSQKTVKVLRGQVKRLRDRLESKQQLINKLGSKQRELFHSNTGSTVLQKYSFSTKAPEKQPAKEKAIKTEILS